MHIHLPEMISDALLKDPNGKLLEIGEAVISVENRTVSFYSDFVQLFKMDTPLKIVLVKDDQETQSFKGRVYLSSQTMLRLVDVTDEVLPGAKTAYMCDVDLRGTLQAQITEEIAEGFMRLQHKTVTQKQDFTVHIHRLSMQAVYFTCREKIEKGQFARLTLAEPSANDILLKVEKAIHFGETLGNYHCMIKDLRPAARINLDAYIAVLCEEQFRLF